MPSFKLCITLTLCTLARLTVVPSSSTGAKTATGLIRPVLDGDHSIYRSVVLAISSCHLNAIASLGNLAVLPSVLEYAISSYVSTSPSDGMSYVSIAFSYSEMALRILLSSTALYSTVSNPREERKLICSLRYANSMPSASTRVKA